MKRRVIIFCLSLLCTISYGQGLTSCDLTGHVLDSNGNPIESALLILENKSNGLRLQTISLEKGNYAFRNLKADRSYKLHISHIAKKTVEISDLVLALGGKHYKQITLQDESIQIEDVNIIANNRRAYDYQSPGMGTVISQEEIKFLASINRSILDFTRLEPHSGSLGYLGKGSRDNYISIDGSGFNNVYGIGGSTATLIGNVVSAEPFSIDVIEEINLNLNPYDLSQGGFTGASINAITKSGTNRFSASIYSYINHDRFVGNKINGQENKISSFSNNSYGLSLSGPVIKNKLFFFINYERNNQITPSTNFLAARAGLEGENVTRVQASDLDEISNYLFETYDYETGPYESYDDRTENDKFLLKMDWQLNSRNRMSVRYHYLNAFMESGNTNSGSFGSPNRVDNLFSMSYLNSGQVRTVSANSIIAELFSSINHKMVNKLSVSYGNFPDARQINSNPFPAVDILKQGRTYISFGSHLFASKNRIDQEVLQFKDELSTSFGNHVLTAGINIEIFNFEYDFTPAFYGSFVFDSLEDFYNSSAIGTITPIGLSSGIGRPSSYSRRYSTQGLDATTFVSPKYDQYSFYIQDEYHYHNLQVSAGVRLDLNKFGGSPLDNPAISDLNFQNEDGTEALFSSGELVSSAIKLSPRIGLSWKLSETKELVLNAGSGIFNGRPSMVRLGDQFINNGLLQGEIKAKNNQANQYPFNSDPNAYIPDDLSGPSSYDLNFTVPNYSPPSLWRSNIGLDLGLKKNLHLSFDLNYSKELNRDHVRNANLDHNNSSVASDGRFVFSNSKLNGQTVIGAYVLDNVSLGDQLFMTLQLKKHYSNNWLAQVSYTFGKSKDINSFGASTTRSAFRNLAVSGNTNSPELAYSDFDQRHRFITFIGKSFSFLGIGKTSMAMFVELSQQGRFSYTYRGRGDINNDGIPNNDLIHIPGSPDDIDLEAYNQNGEMVSVESQWNALDAFISESNYLSQNRGQIAERNGSLLPWSVYTDLKLSQDLNFSKTSLQLSIDLINLGNLLNSSWGLTKIPATTQPIEARENDKFRVNPGLIDEEFINNTGLISRWQLQFGIKWGF